MDERERKLALESFRAFEKMQSIAQNLIVAIEEGCISLEGSKIINGKLFLPYKASGKYIMIQPWSTIGVVHAIGSSNVIHGLSDNEVCQLSQTMEEWLMGDTK